MKTNNLILICLIPILFSSIGVNGQKYGYKPEELPKIFHDTMFTNEMFSFIHTIYGFSGYNYTDFDFRNLSVDIISVRLN